MRGWDFGDFGAGFGFWCAVAEFLVFGLLGFAFGLVVVICGYGYLRC